MRIFFVSILSLFIFSCSRKNENIGKENNVEISSKDVDKINSENEITIETLYNSDEIDGCGEYIIASNDTIGSNKYLFLSNLTDFGIIKLNGKKIILKKDTLESKTVNDNEYISVYKKDNSKVILNLSLEKDYDEGGIYKGKMIIIKGDKKIELNVHGECGC